MTYKFKDLEHETSLEVEAVREKAQITVFGKNEDNGLDLNLEELEKLINALNEVRQEILHYKSPATDVN